MDVTVFIANFREAFGSKVELPFVFWYSDTPAGTTERVNGCLFKCMPALKSGQVVSLSLDTLTCGGGKFYAGYTDMPEHVPTFVAQKERYRQTPEMVLNQLEEMAIPRASKPFLNLARIDRVESFEKLEAVFFLATPDVLSGLVSWALFDNAEPDAVSTPFGSGCCNIVTRAVIENRKGGRSCLLGLFDPSVRLYFDAQVLSFTIPLSRFKEMYHTMRQSCLYDTHAWGKVKTRIGECPFPSPPTDA